MISKIRTCLVAILAAATVVTSVPVYATDTKVDTNIETVENQPSDSEQIEENQVQNAIEQHLNYLYIESPYVETPATQRIVVSWGDGTENIEEIDLSVEHNGDTQTWTSVKSEDGVFLYEKAYADGEDGIYTITKLTVKTAEMETSYLLSDLGMEAKFGVNETYEGMSELQQIEGQPDAEAATDEEQYDVAVMSIDEDGNVIEDTEDTSDDVEYDEDGNVIDNTDSSEDDTEETSDDVEYDEYGNVIDSDNTVSQEEYESQQSASSSESSSSSGSGSAVVDYATQFVGNPYVWGGTSLTNGADCSGFVQSVYANFGVSLPRTSYEQQNAGTEVSYADAQPGDLICYGGHVAIYMGNGQIVHASNSVDGIKISDNAAYRTIVSVRRLV